MNTGQYVTVGLLRATLAEAARIADVEGDRRSVTIFGRLIETFDARAAAPQPEPEYERALSPSGHGYWRHHCGHIRSTRNSDPNVPPIAGQCGGCWRPAFNTSEWAPVYFQPADYPSTTGKEPNNAPSP